MMSTSTVTRRTLPVLNSSITRPGEVEARRREMGGAPANTMQVELSGHHALIVLYRTGRRRIGVQSRGSPNWEL